MPLYDDPIEMALPAGLEPANIFVRSEAVFRLAYGSIEIGWGYSS